jgi:hypothetical protein
LNEKLCEFAEENERIRHQLYARDVEAARKTVDNRVKIEGA